VVKAIASKFPGKIGDANIQAAEAAYQQLANHIPEEAAC